MSHHIEVPSWVDKVLLVLVWTAVLALGGFAFYCWHMIPGHSWWTIADAFFRTLGILKFIDIIELLCDKHRYDFYIRPRWKCKILGHDWNRKSPWLRCSRCLHQGTFAETEKFNPLHIWCTKCGWLRKGKDKHGSDCPFHEYQP